MLVSLWLDDTFVDDLHNRRWMPKQSLLAISTQGRPAKSHNHYKGDDAALSALMDALAVTEFTRFAVVTLPDAVTDAEIVAIAADGPTALHNALRHKAAGTLLTPDTTIQMAELRVP